MSDTPERAVAFDFDGTLTTTDTTKYLMAALLRRRPQRLASLLPVLLRRAFGWMGRQESKTAGLRCLIEGRSLGDIGLAVPHYVVSVRGRLRFGIVRKLKEHLDRGDLVIVATASPSFAVGPVFAGNRLQVIGTDFEVEGGVYTGRCLGNCYGEVKRRRIRAFLEAHDLSSLECAYSDHHSDLPMFALAKECVLVHPDSTTKGLLAHRHCTVLE